ISGDQDLIPEVQKRVSQLMEIAKQQHSHWILAEAYVLESKLALLELDLQTARHLLTQAQDIADKRGLHRLAMKISNEHDALLNQMSIWNELTKRNASLSERVKLAQFEELMVRMIKKQTIEMLPLPPEEPVAFLILGKSGLSLFSTTFNSNDMLNDQLMGGFLTAIQTFSTEVFDRVITRIKLEDYTLLLKPEEPFQLCYVFKGSSYSPQQKLTQLTTALRSNSTIWQALNRADEIGYLLTDTEGFVLKELILKVFSREING
ncbi:MAG: hypothetical protein ACFFBD_02895, partial [Candidatus Hodarchaeota archaeon]